MVYKILLIGPQGSGKGTQAERLGKDLGIPTFAMGQLLRDEIAAKTDIGQQVEAIMKGGDLVSDEQAATVLKARLARPDTANGYLLDGYPRNLVQYAVFTFDTPTHVLVIDVPREESLLRLGGRLTCGVCGKVYAMRDGFSVGGSCVCGGQLIQRDDDTPLAINRRLDIYEQDTLPVIQKFKEKGLVSHVDGVGTPEEITRRLRSALGLTE